jgi:ribosomal protein L3
LVEEMRLVAEFQ